MLRRALIVLHAFLGVAAVGAGQAFVRDPSGGALGMSKDVLKGSPFSDFRIPGLFLAVVLGSANLASAGALLKRHPLAPWLSFATGALLVVWVAIQTLIIGFRHWSQVLWWVMFPLVAILGALLVREESRAEDSR